jgi:hypothetical protein
MSGHHYRRPWAPDPALLWPSRQQNIYASTPTHRPPDFVSRSPLDGYLSDYSSDQSMREQSESLSFYENNLERHKGKLMCF